MSRNLLIGGVLLLLLLGCIGARAQVKAPVAKTPAVGDGDVSPTTVTDDGNLLSDSAVVSSDDVVPPSYGGASAAQITSDDLDLSTDSDDDLISSSDVIDQPF